MRVRNIVDAYRLEGHQVEVVGVLGSENYEKETGFLPFPSHQKLASVISNSFLMEDYAIGQLFSSDLTLRAMLLKKILKKPDIIQVEHPWLFKAANFYAKTHNIKIIYSSHNIEWKLKQEILLDFVDQPEALGGAEVIKVDELYAIQNADAVISVSETDAFWIKQYTSKNVLLAPNGVKEWSVDENSLAEAMSVTKQRFALYCASAHPPNVTGFFEMLEGGFGSLKPDEKLVIAGGAGWSIAGDIRVHQSAKLAEKIIVAGSVNQSCLEGLLELTACIILPLTKGGGTNLKTAEALWSGKPIVGTTIAMRGFESFLSSPGVFIADNSVDFKQALRKAMTLDKLNLSNGEIDKRRSVLWKETLKPLGEFLKSLRIA